MEIYLVFADAIKNSNKFWSATVEGNNVTVQWGRVGYKPQGITHQCSNPQQALIKFNNLVAEKKSKGYRESQPQMDGDRTITDIRRAIQLLSIIRPCMQTRNFHSGYVDAINEYLRIIPTPLGMQIDIHGIYRTVADVDHQIEILNSLLPTTATLTAITSVNTLATTTQSQTVSLKAISKNFWRHL